MKPLDQYYFVFSHTAVCYLLLYTLILELADITEQLKLHKLNSYCIYFTIKYWTNYIIQVYVVLCCTVVANVERKYIYIFMYVGNILLLYELHNYSYRGKLKIENNYPDIIFQLFSAEEFSLQ